MSFSGFAAKDFEAYQRQKWQSNAFNLERLQVKEKMRALGRELESGLVSADGSLLVMELSAEHPAVWNHRSVDCQYLFFSRNEEARRQLDGFISRKRTMASLVEDPSPLRNHIFLAVRLDAQGVELSLKLHSDAAVDRDNLQRKAQDFFHREKILVAISGLAEGFDVGLESEGLRPVATLDDEHLQTLIRDLASANTWLTVRRLLDRDDPRAGGPEFVSVARETLQQQLLPLLNHVAWSRDNDFLSMGDTLRQEAVRHKSKGLAKNDRVRVVQGIFAGKTGVVQSVDAKGSLKVLLGKMSVKLTGEDVVKA